MPTLPSYARHGALRLAVAALMIFAAQVFCPHRAEAGYRDYTGYLCHVWIHGVHRIRPCWPWAGYGGPNWPPTWRGSGWRGPGWYGPYWRHRYFYR